MNFVFNVSIREKKIQTKHQNSDSKQQSLILGNVVFIFILKKCLVIQAK